jgi:hypothetical protein
MARSIFKDESDFNRGRRVDQPHKLERRANRRGKNVFLGRD